jgi:5-methylcytosine-specific restriction endonuclease McrA
MRSQGTEFTLVRPGARRQFGVVKTCRKCGEAKPFEEFYRDRTATDGLRPSCKRCWNAASTAYNKANPEVTRKAKRRHHAKHRERDNEQARERHRRWREANRDEHRERSRRWYRANRDLAISSLRGLGVLDRPSRTYAEILRRDPCAYCGAAMEDIDHIDPIVSGGENHWTNLTAACGSCNNRKYSFPLLLFLARR